MHDDDSFELVIKDPVNVYSEPSGLALTFAESLLRKLHRVNIYSENPKAWLEHTTHLRDNYNLKIFSINNLQESNYNVYFSILSSDMGDKDINKLLNSEKEMITSILSVLKDYKTFVVVCPYSQPIEYEIFYSRLFNIYFKNLNKTKVVFYENLLGKRMLLTTRDVLSKLTISLLEQGSVGSNIRLFPTDLEDFTTRLRTSLLNDKGYNKNTVFMGRQLDSDVLKKDLIERGVTNAQMFKSINDADGLGRIYADCDLFVELKMKNKCPTNIVETLEYFKIYGYKKETDSRIVGNPSRNNKLLQEDTHIENKGDRRKEEHTEVHTTFVDQRKAEPVQKTILINKPVKKIKVRPSIKIPKFKIQIPYKTLIRKFNPKWLNMRHKITAPKEHKENNEKVRLKNKTLSFFKYLLLIFLVLLFPYILSVTAFMFLIIGGKQLLNSKVEESSKYFVLSEKIGGISGSLSRLLIQTPIVGGFYTTANTITNLTFTSSDILADSVDVLEKSQKLFIAVLNDSNFDLNEKSGEISLSLDSLYRKISFLQSEYQEIPERVRNILAVYVDERNIERVKTEIVSFTKVSSNASKILGSEGKSSYLVLFQNNMELRPTGGFIGSFGILSFQDGKMINLEVYDVYAADGQLKGYVKPPYPIVKYLNQAVWYLRDSNWDPDFVETSQKAQWFLGKEMDIKVDGVFSVDLEFVKGLLEVTGPIYLNDYDKEINAQNMYEITQYEVEKEFFPGSRKKSNFLSSLVREIIFKMKSDYKIDYIKLAKVIHEALQEKHFQLSFNSYDVANEFQRLGWDGGIRDPKCIDVNCYSDLMGVVEANVGVNKANYYVERKGSLKNSLVDGKVVREVDLVYTSNANPALGFKGTYKNYIRVMGPPDSVFEDVKLISIDGEKSIPADIEKFDNRTEAGIYVEIASGQTKRINFSWSSDTQLNFNTNGKYLLNIRKQSGINEFNFDVNINLPQNIHFGVVPNSMLTQVGGVRYNTMLSKDENIGIYW